MFLQGGVSQHRRALLDLKRGRHLDTHLSERWGLTCSGRGERVERVERVERAALRRGWRTRGNSGSDRSYLTNPKQQL